MRRSYYDGKDFWKENAKNKRLKYPINDEIISKAEDLLSIKFPQSFINIMKIQNGGELKYPNFILPVGERETTSNQERVRLPSIEPIHFENDDLSILSSEELLNEVNLPKGFIVLWTDFHYWVVLDYRNKNDNPPVIYIAENFLVSKETTEWEFIKIADTFDGFLKKLFR